MLVNIFYVGIGGGIGAICRYLLGLIPVKSSFPLITFLINISGAILIGFIVEVFKTQNFSDSYLLFFKTGLCGGFTTFSTFSLESFELLHKEAYSIACLYIISSLIFSVLGVLIGIQIAKIIN